MLIFQTSHKNYCIINLPYLEPKKLYSKSLFFRTHVFEIDGIYYDFSRIYALKTLQDFIACGPFLCPKIFDKLITLIFMFFFSNLGILAYKLFTVTFAH